MSGFAEEDDSVVSVATKEGNPDHERRQDTFMDFVCIE